MDDIKNGGVDLPPVNLEKSAPIQKPISDKKLVKEKNSSRGSKNVTSPIRSNKRSKKSNTKIINDFKPENKNGNMVTVLLRTIGKVRRGKSIEQLQEKLE